ncbi:UNVERIFIED_CONTAM: hypothetical protein Sradi_1382000 [Sesamum radiatum]|uniref:Uncharacterized protein n=1 Tax=Sesamum radiatum TaxID=300843 RepID=A0AAW2UTW6_SESRA
MVNLFELNVGVSTNRLLADKPHQDGAHFFYSICMRFEGPHDFWPVKVFPHVIGSVLSRSRSDVSRMSSSGDQIEEKVTAPEFKSSFPNRKSNGTPMKMLIAQEMSKEVVSRPDPPNLVAKLMGLDALPRQEAESTTQRSHSRGRPRSHSDIPMSCWEQQKGFFHHVEPNEYRDVYEIWQKSQDEERYEETINDNKMALVRQKFVEAKRLSMDEKLRKSKQFQDAIEVLNSNKDLFLKCLQEPNSIFSQQLYSQQKFPPASYQSYENPTQPTRIVVLKPSPGKPHDINAVSSPHSEPPKRFQCGDSFGNEGEDENQESREIARAITQQMREKLGRHLRDETLTSSVFSNGYAGDESSFNKSEIEYADGNLSDSEIMSPVSRHSWDYVNRLCSPYSSSSFSRASYSPESSVCREAKKRLSERWAMMASNRSYQEQRHVRRGSSTLGEMLALSEAKKVASPGEAGSSKEEPKDSYSLLVSEQRTDENVDSSPRNLTRSKSVPVSSTEFGTRLDIGVSVSDNGKPEVPKEDAKARTVKSSFKGKVSSLFFSRSKKPVTDKSLVSEDELHSFPEEICSDGTANISDKLSTQASAGLQGPSRKVSSSNLIGRQGVISPETGLAMENPCESGNQGEQPSPISVLDEHFEEDERKAKVFPHYAKPDQQGVKSPLDSTGSNLIDKSPPIGSIARTLSWDDSCIDTASSHPAKECLATETDEDEQELYTFVKTLLSAAGLQALVDIAGYGSDLGQRAIPCIGANNHTLDSALLTMVDKVWGRMNVWFSSKVKCVSDDSGDENNLVVERLVRNEVAGKGWMDHLRLEIDDLGMEIEARLLEELLQESVVELTGRV